MSEMRCVIVYPLSASDKVISTLAAPLLSLSQWMAVSVWAVVGVGTDAEAWGPLMLLPAAEKKATRATRVSGGARCSHMRRTRLKKEIQ